MKESAPKFNRDQLLKQKELTEEQIMKLLEIKISQGTTREAIKRSIESGVWLRFVVTKDFDIFVNPGSATHEVIMEDNGIEAKDCVIDNGLLRKDEDTNELVFSYQSSPITILHLASEKKLPQFLKEYGVGLKGGYKHAHVYE